MPLAQLRQQDYALQAPRQLHVEVVWDESDRAWQSTATDGAFLLLVSARHSIAVLIEAKKMVSGGLPTRSFTAKSFLKIAGPRFPYMLLDQQGSAQPKIRVLELLPGRLAEPLQCDLKAVPLQSSPPYEALSYCWGDPEEQKAINCNGSKLRIPAALEEALRGLRFPDKKRVLWADAICINQKDDNEKNIQVQLMRDIYAQASRTLVWLGDSKDKYEKGLSIFAKISVKISLAGLRLRYGLNNVPPITVRSTQTGLTRNLSPFSNVIYLNMIRMLRRPWFQRAWVVQEVVVSKRPIVIWDGMEITWYQLVRALREMSSVQFPLAFIVSLQHIASIEGERIRYKGGNTELLGLLLRQQRCLATNPRDKLYSFYGLVNPSSANKLAISINYRDRLASIYTDAAVKILQDAKNLDLLSRPPLLAESELKGLPSWVPNWSISISCDIPQTFAVGQRSLAGTESRFKQKMRPRFSAAGHSQAEPRFSESYDELIVEGYLLDTIMDAGPVFEGVKIPSAVSTLRSIGEGWFHTLRSFLRARNVISDWKDVFLNSKPGYKPAEEIFWHTLCAGELSRSARVAGAAAFWARATRPSPFRLKNMPSFLQHFGLVYSVYILVGHLVTTKPLLDYELQGRFILNRRMISTQSGYAGLASCGAKNGDCIALCKGSSVPLVLRKYGEEGKWQVVGDVYVHEIMKGEAWREERCRDIVLV